MSLEKFKVLLSTELTPDNIRQVSEQLANEVWSNKEEILKKLEALDEMQNSYKDWPGKYC